MPSIGWKLTTTLEFYLEVVDIFGGRKRHQPSTCWLCVKAHIQPLAPAPPPSLAFFEILQRAELCTDHGVSIPLKDTTGRGFVISLLRKCLGVNAVIFPETRKSLLIWVAKGSGKLPDLVTKSPGWQHWSTSINKAAAVSVIHHMYVRRNMVIANFICCDWTLKIKNVTIVVVSKHISACSVTHKQWE